MRLLRFTLVSEGSSDRALLAILIWTIQQHANVDIQPRWSDLRRLPRPPRSLGERIRLALELYPCELLFIHRDADRAGRRRRRREIEKTLKNLPHDAIPPAVCVVPVRALEAWFLFDEQAIRFAASNPNGKTPLELPSWREIERLPDPKNELRGLVLAASGLEGRRRKRVDPSRAVHRIADLVTDYSPLRNLPAFRAFEEDLEEILARRPPPADRPRP